MKRIAAFILVFIICFSVVSPSALASTRDTSLEQQLATDLKALSLFNGISDTDFDLCRAPTRTEAIVMLIRVLGKENTVKNGTWTHPFTDVAAWADKYVGYAYQNGLTNGVSATQFGSGNATAGTYLTFVLRALGYSDKNGADFTWDNPFTLAKSINILPNKVDTTTFWRADVVLISYSALPVKLKGTEQALCDKLISDGVFAKQQYDTYYDATAISTANSKTVLSAEEIYAQCSPAVFYIEVYDKSGKAYASGSGFFLDSAGTAVTNYHVIKGANSAKITTSDTKKVYNVAGVYDYNAAQDWAVLKIDGSGFPCLKTGDSSTVVGGATVYAIGSPLGLQSTISQGLISNTNRAEDGVSYIQTSAAISSGSSGGALINKYGEAIGITSASYVSGQNLNLALPMSYLSGITKSSVTPLSDISGTATTAPISISVSSAYVTLKAGASSTIYVEWTGGSDDDSIYWDSSNENVATAAWGDWVSDEVLELEVYGESSGTATITVYVDAQHICNITVTVSAAAPYDTLRASLLSKGTYNSSIGGYQLTFYYQNTDFYIIYQPSKGKDIILASDLIYNGANLETYLIINENSSALYKLFLSSPAISGYDYLTKSSFCSSVNLSPKNYQGSAYARAEFGSLCTTTLAGLLSAAEVLLYNNNIPLTIKDLGFTAMYRELES